MTDISDIERIRKNNTKRKVLTTENVVGDNVEEGVKVAPTRARRRRIPLIHQRNLIEIENPDPAYVYYRANDEGDNIFRRLRAGWVIVDRSGNEIEIDEKMQDSSWKQKAFCQHVGDGVMAYMMKIPREFYEEDQRELDRITDLTEDGMYSGRIDGIAPSETYGKIEKKISR